MIVREVGSEFLLVTQPDHARLSAQLMRHWRADGFPERPSRDAALYATEQHDIGWTDEDAAPRVDPQSGRPYDFMTLPIGSRHAIWTRALRILPQRSTYAAALVAQHALTIYRRFRPDAAWAGFFETLERERDRWFWAETRPDGSSGGPLDPRREARLSFLQDYTTVRLGDLLSLVFCNGWDSPEELEGYEIRLTGDTLVVTPDPFEGGRVEFTIDARRVARAACTGDDRLRAALAASRVERLTGALTGAPARRLS